jgi:hypothetical protein
MHLVLVDRVVFPSQDPSFHFERHPQILEGHQLRLSLSQSLPDLALVCWLQLLQTNCAFVNHLARSFCRWIKETKFNKNAGRTFGPC